MPIAPAGFNFARSLLPVASKLPDSEDDRGVVAHFLGIPVGFQFGTAAGLTGIPALLVDILTDPVNLLLPGLGALTKTGRAAAGVGKILKAAKLVEETAPVSEKLIPLVQRALEGGAKTLPEVQALLKKPLLAAAQMETASLRNVQRALTGLETGGTDLARETLLGIRNGTLLNGELKPAAGEINRMLSVLERQGPGALSGHLQGTIAKREQLRELLNTALSANDFASAKGAMKQLRGLAPNEAWKGLFSRGMQGEWKQAFEAAKSGLPIEALAEGARKQAQAGQRALVNLKVPFGPEKALIAGAPVLGAVAETLGKAGKALGVARAGQAVQNVAAAATPLEPLQAAPFTLHDTISTAAGAIERSTKEALDFHQIDVNGADLLKERVAGLKDHIELANQLGAKTKDEYYATMKGMGLGTAEDHLRVNELLQNRDKYLTRPAEAVKGIEGPYGPTSVFGELTPAAKAAGITDRHVMVGQSLDSAFRKFGQLAVDNGILEGTIPDYMMRSVRIVPGKEEEVAKAFGRLSTETTTFWKHAQERTIPAWDQLMEMEKKGLVEVEKDPGKLVQNYIASYGKVSADASFFDGIALSRVPAEVTRKSGTKDFLLHLIVPGGKGDRFAQRVGKYTRITDSEPSLMTLARQVGERAGIKGFGYTRHIWVHNDIVKDLRAAIEPGFALPSRLPVTAIGPEKALAAALQVNSIAKRSLLFPGTVHFINLTEKLLVSAGWDGFKAALAKTLPDLVKGSGARSYLETLPDMVDAVRHGLRMDAPLDAEVDTFQKALRFVSNKLPVTKPVVDAVRSMESWASGKLWGQYHAPLKLYAYNEILTRNAEKFAGLDLAALKREIATHVNESFGGGNLEKFVGSKKGQQLLRLFFLAPDWLIGNTKIATDVFANTFMGAERRLLPEGAVLAQDARAFFARQYALRAGLMMAFVGNFVNLAFTGHFMHDNEDKTRIQLPGTDETGRPVYLSMFDPFMFPFELAASPFQFIGRKIGPVPRLAIGQLTSKDFYGAPIVTTKDGPLDNFAKRVGFTLEQVAPISAQVVAGVQQARVPLALRALSLAGLPVRSSPRSAAQAETAPNETPRKTKQELRAEVQAEMQKQIEQAVNQFGAAHQLMMKSDQYRRGLDQAANLPVVPAGALLPVMR